MTPYEISPLLPDPDDKGVRRIRVDADYIRNEPSLSAAQKAAIAALPPGGVWSGRVVQIKRLEEPTLH
ncbi:MAG TPA: hypothetical protein VMS38_34665 [Pseudorhodoferax sp.]|nr:hypothetical protein [Pseudorhodoferax sp.]